MTMASDEAASILPNLREVIIIDDDDDDGDGDCNLTGAGGFDGMDMDHEYESMLETEGAFYHQIQHMTPSDDAARTLPHLHREVIDIEDDGDLVSSGDIGGLDMQHEGEITAQLDFWLCQLDKMVVEAEEKEERGRELRDLEEALKQRDERIQLLEAERDEDQKNWGHKEQWYQHQLQLLADEFFHGYMDDAGSQFQVQI